MLSIGVIYTYTYRAGVTIHNQQRAGSLKKFFMICKNLRAAYATLTV